MRSSTPPSPPAASASIMCSILSAATDTALTATYLRSCGTRILTSRGPTAGSIPRSAPASSSHATAPTPVPQRRVIQPPGPLVDGPRPGPLRPPTRPTAARPRVRPGPSAQPHPPCPHVSPSPTTSVQRGRVTSQRSDGSAVRVSACRRGGCSRQTSSNARRPTATASSGFGRRSRLARVILRGRGTPSPSRRRGWCSELPPAGSSSAARCRTSRRTATSPAAPRSGCAVRCRHRGPRCAQGPASRSRPWRAARRSR